MEKELLQKNILNGTFLGNCFVSKKLEEKYAHYLGDEFNKEIVLNYKQTTAMRYINHSYEPNLKLQKKN